MYAELRARGPVHPLNWAGLGPIALVVRHADARALLEDPRLVEDTEKPVPSAAPGGATTIDHPSDARARLRWRLVDAVSTCAAGPASGQIREEAEQLLDRTRSRGEIELVAEYAAVVPLAIVGRIVGVPVGAAERFRGFAYASRVRQTTGQKAEALRASQARFSGHVKTVLAARRREPRDDVLSTLARGAPEDDRVGRDELAEAICQMILGGYVSAANLIGNATLALLRYPDQLDLLRRHPALIDTAIEELLRFESPIELSQAYRATEDMDLVGTPIARGTRLHVAVPSVNRDEAAFARPDSLDLARSPCPHLCFAAGDRADLGAPLARLAARLALPALIQGAPSLDLTDPSRVEWMTHPVLRGLSRLPLRI